MIVLDEIIETNAFVFILLKSCKSNTINGNYEQHKTVNGYQREEVERWILKIVSFDNKVLLTLSCIFSQGFSLLGCDRIPCIRNSLTQ